MSFFICRNIFYNSSYEIPKLTHIWYLNLKDDPNKNESSIVSQLEDAWIELDSLIGEEILGQGQ